MQIMNFIPNKSIHIRQSGEIILRIVTAGFFLWVMSGFFQQCGADASADSSIISWQQISNSHPGTKYIKALARNQEYIILGTSSGIILFNKNDKTYTSPFPALNVFITSLYAAEKNLLWAGTVDGVYLLNLTSHQIISHYTRNLRKGKDGRRTIPGISSDKVTVLTGTSDEIFVGTESWGISIIDIRTGNVRDEKITGVDLPSQEINDITVTPAILIVSTTKGVIWKKRWDSEWTEIPPTSRAYGCNVRQACYWENRLLLGTSGDGILSVDLNNPNNVTQYCLEDGQMPSDFISSLVPDGAYLWAATFNGLAQYDDYSGIWNTHAGFPGEMPDRVCIDGNLIYVSSSGDGLFYSDKKVPEIFISPENNYCETGMKITGGIRTGKSDTQNTFGSIMYRDSEIGGHFTNRSVLQIFQTNNYRFNNILAMIDFAAIHLPARIWTFEVIAEWKDNGGLRNRTSALFLYDSIKPVIELPFMDTGRQFTSEPRFFLSGRIIEYRLRTLTCKTPGTNFEIKTDNYGNFNVSLNVHSAETHVVFSAADYCNNSDHARITIVLDREPPVLHSLADCISLNAFEDTFEIPYQETYLKWAQLRPEGMTLPVSGIEDKTIGVIRFKIPSFSGKKKARIELCDYAGNKTALDTMIEKNYNRAEIKLSPYNEVTNKSAFTLSGTIKSPLPVIAVHVFLNEAPTAFSFSPETGKFSAGLTLAPGQNIITISATAASNFVTEKLISLYYEIPEKTAGPDMEEFLKLQRELEALKKVLASLQQKTNTIRQQPAVRTVTDFDYYPALRTVKAAGGQSMLTMARQYLGNENFAEVISFINSLLSAADISGGRKMIIPNRKLIDWMLENKSPFVYDIIKSGAYALFYSNSGKDIAAFKRMLTRSLGDSMLNTRIRFEGRKVFFEIKSGELTADSIGWNVLVFNLSDEGYLIVKTY